MGDVGNIPSRTAAVETVVSVPYVASFTPDGGFGALVTFDILLTGNITIANGQNFADGQRFVLRLRQDGTGGRSISFGSAYRGSSDTALPSTTGTASATDYFAFRYNAASSKFDFMAPNKGF